MTVVQGSPELLDHVLGLLAEDHVVLGPVERAGAVMTERIEGVADLPAGRGTEQAPGRYRLVDRDDGALFGHAVGPTSPRAHLVPDGEVIVRARRTDDGHVVEPLERPTPTALVGVRACDLAAMALQDRVLGVGEHSDAAYVARRDTTFVVAVQCTEAASTCFCAATRTGPSVDGGADLVVTELVDSDRHRVVIEARSDRGEALLARVDAPEAPADVLGEVAAAVGRAADQQRTIDPGAAVGALVERARHPHWDDLATRCLACGNCTLVCPTCFCTSVVDVTDLSGDRAERRRRWESCFTSAHSELGGRPVRPDTRSRYRQWLTHKFDTWTAQYGSSGCVGCGRCITWCPVGIDVTEELNTLLAEPEGVR